MNRSWGITLAAVAVFGAAVPISAQVEMSAPGPTPLAILDGQIIDSISGTPIAGVLVRMDSGQESFTDANGRFHFAGLPEGRRLVALLTEDCRITWGEVTVVERFPRSVRFRLPPAFGAKAEQEEREAEERKRTGGRRLDQQDIDRSNASNVLELIRRISPGMVSPMQGDPGNVSSIVSSRGRSMGAEDPPVVVIDGVRTPGAEGLLSTMRPAEVAEIEVQPGAAAGWEYGSAGASGVIKITMRRGLATGEPELREVSPCVVPAFPGG